MKAILGRLSDLGLRELFKILTSAGAEGALEVEAPGGPARVEFRNGHVAGQVSPAIVLAYATRSGTFCFRPGEAGEAQEWVPQEEFLARLDSQAQVVSKAATLAGIGAEATGATLDKDPLAELRDSLAEVPLPGGVSRVLIASADPRPYRTLAPQWRQRNWEVTLSDGPAWPEASLPNLLIVHLPASGTLAGQGEAWLGLVERAGNQRPAVPAIWVGGLGDPWLRHQAIMAGVEFMVPAPMGEMGEAARWFREELTLLAERLLTRRTEVGGGAAEAFRDFFLALHVDATPSEARASLLRFAGTFFGRGVLFGIRDVAFQSVGGYGFPLTTAVRVSRGASLLEAVIVERRPVAVEKLAGEGAALLAKALKATGGLQSAEILPVLQSGECVALFLGDQPLPGSGGSETLAAVLARSGGMLGL